MGTSFFVPISNKDFDTGQIEGEARGDVRGDVQLLSQTTFEKTLQTQWF